MIGYAVTIPGTGPSWMLPSESDAAGPGALISMQTTTLGTGWQRAPESVSTNLGNGILAMSDHAYRIAGLLAI